MHSFYLLAFTIPITSIVTIGLYQVLDETFKKKFVLERRASRQPAEGAPRRRHSDAVPPGKLRHAETAKGDSLPEVTVAQIHGA